MKSIVVLVSGGGTNLQRIIDVIEAKEISNALIQLVVADRDCYAIERAENHNIQTAVIKRGRGFSDRLSKLIPPGTDLIVLAGFLTILSPEFCQQFSGKIINIHPSLLPKYGGNGMWGDFVHKAVLDNQESRSGATVHYVTAGVDQGDIILQKGFDLSPDETLDSLKEKVHKVEYEIFPEAIRKVLTL